MYTQPLTHLPWISWIDKRSIPSVVIAGAVLAAFIPFYDFDSLAPRMPLDGAGFPPAFALMLMFLLHLTRGAARDMHELAGAGRIGGSESVTLGALPLPARLELVAGLALGALLVFRNALEPDALDAPAHVIAAVCCAMFGYAVTQIHVLTFCIRQALAYRRIASHFEIDLLAPEIHTVLSNPLIRFVVLGMAGFSLLVVIHEAAPYPSLQARVVQVGLLAGLAWATLILVSLIPVFRMKARVSAIKRAEIDLVRQALRGAPPPGATTQFGAPVAQFGIGDLMVYEERLKQVWEWPIRAHIRRLLLFGLLPPLTWVLAAAVEMGFESLVVGG